MRKMMMAALFSVLSLSACAVQDPGPQDDESIDESMDESASEQTPEMPDHGTEIGEPSTTTRRATNMQRDIAVDEAAVPFACYAASDCVSNVCELSTHTCRPFPF